MSAENNQGIRKQMTEPIADTTTAHIATGKINRRDFLKIAGAAMGSILFPDAYAVLARANPDVNSGADFLASHEIKRGDVSEPARVMMTYDDWPSNPGQLEQILTAYKDAGQKATFFFLGDRLRMFADGKFKSYGWKPDDLSMITKEGHEIASHGWQHEVPMTQLTNVKLNQEIGQSIQAMKDVFPDIKVCLFRAPFGCADDRVRSVAAQSGLQHVMWGVESGGVDNRTEEYVLRGVDRVGKGSIVLSHMMRYYDVIQSGKILKALKDKGYSMVTVSDGLALADQLVTRSVNPELREKFSRYKDL